MQLAKSRSVIPGLTFVESIDSTNAELARNHASLGDFTVLIAGEQTSGQGRAGRNWVSMSGASIAVSFLLRPARIEVASLVTLMAAASAHQALMHLFPSVSFSIKWPNDILIAERKLAGILAQRNEDGSVVCGIGINLSHQSQAPDTATPLSDYVITDFDEVTSAVLASMKTNWELLQSTQGSQWLVDYVRGNCSTLGSEVRAELASGESIVGTATKITASGHLVIQSEKEHTLAAADVWHLRKQ
jgi:BirA family biotin operon repressor/biotin-[acetyl-CoA-carboxylase] ligase